MNYPEDLKQKMIKCMRTPNNELISKIAREEGIAEQTLRNWQKAAREKEIAAPGKDTTADQWTTEDKFLIVVETAKMNESELAEYARQNGLFVEQIKAWKYACLQANGGVAKEAAELNKKLREYEEIFIVIHHSGMAATVCQRTLSSSLRTMLMFRRI